MPELIHHPGLTNEAYHHLKAVSPSQIKVLGRSPLHLVARPDSSTEGSIIRKAN